MKTMKIRKLTRKELSAAYQQYARKHGYYTKQVRVNTDLKLKAIEEWLGKHSN